MLSLKVTLRALDKSKSHLSQKNTLTFVGEGSASLINFPTACVYLSVEICKVSVFLFLCIYQFIELSLCSIEAYFHYLLPAQLRSLLFFISFSISMIFFSLPVLNSCEISTFQDSCRRLLVISHWRNLVTTTNMSAEPSERSDLPHLTGMCF